MNTENNRLLAEFMGLKPKLESPDVYSYSDMPFFSVRESCPEKVMEAISKYVKYDSSWDWLMEVVEKIESIKGTQIFINGISCEVMFKGRVISKHFNTKIEAVYNACVEFVKYYNSIS
jgi:hypothetical protein